MALDADDKIVSEYLAALNGTGTSGLATKIVRKLYRMRRNTDICRQVTVTRGDDPPGSYNEVPEGLKDFDIDDQKFIAVSVAEATRPQIHTAVDGEWWDRKQDFVDCGIDVQFACGGDFLDRDRGLK